MAAKASHGEGEMASPWALSPARVLPEVERAAVEWLRVGALNWHLRALLSARWQLSARPSRVWALGSVLFRFDLVRFFPFFSIPSPIYYHHRRLIPLLIPT
jgi:hypothetical protein